MSSNSDNPDLPEGTPTPRERVRPGTPNRERTTERARGRRRLLNTEEAQTPAAPRDVMDPGPAVPWPTLPRNEDGEVNPPAIQQRVRELYALDRRAATEFILETLHMLLLQQRALDDIARIFGVTIRTVSNWRQKLRERIGDDFRARVPTDLAAEQVANLKRTKAYAWQQAARCPEALDKLRWVNLTVKCEQELAALYKELKVYRAVEPRREVNEDTDSGVSPLVILCEQFLLGYDGDDSEGKGGKKASADNAVDDPEADLLPPEYDENDVAHMF